MRVRKSILDDSKIRPREESPEDWTTSLTPRVKGYYRCVGELGVSNGGMFKCSGDHSNSREEHLNDRAEEHL